MGQFICLVKLLSNNVVQGEIYKKARKTWKNKFFFFVDASKVLIVMSKFFFSFFGSLELMMSVWNAVAVVVFAVVVGWETY